MAAETIAADRLGPLPDLRPPARLTDPKPPADSGPIRIRRLLPQPGNAEAAVLVAEESQATADQFPPRPESTRGELPAAPRRLGQGPD